MKPTQFCLRTSGTAFVYVYIEQHANNRLTTSVKLTRQVFIYLDPILIYISLWIDCLFSIRKIAVCFLWLSLPGDCRVTDEALLAETT